MTNKKEIKTLRDAEILQYLYEEGLIDITGEGTNLTLYSDTTGKGLLNIFKAGYKKAKQQDKEFIKDILDEIEERRKTYEEAIMKTDFEELELQYNALANQLKSISQIIKQKSGFEELE